MKIKRLLPIAALMLLVIAISCGKQTKNATPDLSSYVNPFIGTGGHGHTFPGATLPNGMVQPSPDTRVNEWDACSGYYYPDSTINGFSQTHLSGTGCSDLGDVLIMPTTGDQDVREVGEEPQEFSWASPFSHENEVAEPGYYSVQLDRYNVKAEITATMRTALYRFTYPESEKSGLILDLGYGIHHPTSSDLQIEVVSDTELRGHKMNKSWAWERPVNFYAKFSKPFKCEIVTDTVDGMDEGTPVRKPQLKALLSFEPTAAGEEIFVKIGLSAVDLEGAQKNVEAEVPEFDFDGVRKAAREKWNTYLSKIAIETADEDVKTMFYTGLYHTGMQPCIFSDVDGRYFGNDHKVHQGDVENPNYTIFSTWDTFRAYHPLMTIIQPELNQRFVDVLLQKAEEGGVLPKWELWGNYTGCMIGYHCPSIIADAYVKGYDSFDLNRALKLMVRTAEYDTTGICCPVPVMGDVMPDSRYYKNAMGYIPCEKRNESVAEGLEYAYDDFCISVIAKAAGDTATAAKYAEMAKYYEKYFDPSVGFMRGKDSKGQWRTPFDPRYSGHRVDDYCEGTAWQWLWFVPQDVEGLANLLGGNDKMAEKLDELLAADSKLEGERPSVDISGLIGQYAHGNEPSHHVLYLYNYIGRPWRTQELVDEVLQTLYFNDPNGLSGNEDCGQMSAWYILSAMGFYQVCPGIPTYTIGRPIVDKAVMKLKDGKTFTVVVTNNSKENKYVQKMTLNGKALEKPFFEHSDIVAGGTLEIEMGPQPVK